MENNNELHELIEAYETLTDIQELVESYEVQIAQYEANIKETQVTVLRTTDQRGRRTLQDHIRQQKQLMNLLQRVVGDLKNIT